jgi:glutamine synthetase
MVTLPAYDERPAFDLALCDGRMPDGSPWPYCPRTALKHALKRLKDEAGLTMKVAFEHEFLVQGMNQRAHPAFSVSSGRTVSHLAEKCMVTLAKADIQLEQFQAEYGFDQFEISSVPADPLRAADKAVLTMETIRDQPKPDPKGIGSGVHIHFSLYKNGKPITAEKDWITATSGAFAQGILDHAETAVLFSCPTTNSYLRLRPHSWVGSYTCLGVKNREAMIRLVPRKADANGNNPNASLEYRVADGTANVYLTLAAIIGAGLDGLKANKKPHNVSQDPESLTAEARKGMAIRHLPQSLQEALLGFDTAQASTWLGDDLVAAYMACRREDQRQFGAIEPAAASSVLQKIY